MAAPLTIRVRTARSGDLPDILRLVAELHPDDPPPDPSGAAAVFPDILSREGHALLVAELAGEPVGTLHLIVVPNLTHDGTPWAIVENVSVDESHQRSGVGRALIEDAERRAREAGCYKIQLLSGERRGAGGFYERLGYEHAARGYRKYF